MGMRMRIIAMLGLLLLSMTVCEAGPRRDNGDPPWQRNKIQAIRGAESLYEKELRIRPDNCQADWMFVTCVGRAGMRKYEVDKARFAE